MAYKHTNVVIAHSGLEKDTVNVDRKRHNDICYSIWEVKESEAYLFVVKILRSMDASQSSVAKCAKIPGWHYVLFKLITREQAPHQHNGLKDVEEREKEEQALVDTVLEIIFRVMWKGIEGYDKESWRVLVCFVFNLYHGKFLISLFFPNCYIMAGTWFPGF